MPKFSQLGEVTYEDLVSKDLETSTDIEDDGKAGYSWGSPKKGNTKKKSKKKSKKMK